MSNEWLPGKSHERAEDRGWKQKAFHCCAAEAACMFVSYTVHISITTSVVKGVIQTRLKTVAVVPLGHYQVRKGHLRLSRPVDS